MNADDLHLLEARWRLREITEADLHSVADDLLQRGEDDEALIRLFALDRDELPWAGAEAFETVLRALGGGTMTEAEAVEIVLRDIATGVLAGAVTPLAATTRVEAMWVRTRYQYDVLLPWRDLQEELSDLEASDRSYLGNDRAWVEADLAKLARATVERHS